MKVASLAIIGILCIAALWMLRSPGASASGIEMLEPFDAKADTLAPSASPESTTGEPAAMDITSPRQAVPLELEEDAAPIEQAPGEAQWGRFDLTVLGDNSGKPIPGLYLNIKAAVATGDEERQVSRGSQGETNTQGFVSVQLLANEPLFARLMAIGVEQPLATLELEPLQPDEVREQELRIDESLIPHFWVRIIEAQNDLPLPQAAVLEVDPYGQSLHTDGPLDAANWINREPFARPDTDGLLALPISRIGQKRFAAVAEGYGPVFFTQQQGAKSPDLAFQVKLAPSASLEILVVDMTGSSLSSVKVRLDAEFSDLTGTGDRNATGWILGRHGLIRATDTAGRANFEGLSQGAEFRASLLLPDEDKGWQVASPSIPPFKPGEKRELTLVARPSTEVHGTAFDQHGLPAAGVELILLQDSGQWGEYLNFGSSGAAERTVTVADDGRFHLGSVPAGHWILAPKTLRNHNRRLYRTDDIELTGLFAPLSTHFQLTGETNSHNLTLELWRDLYVRGVVVNEQGDPQPNSHIIARFEDDGGFQIERTNEQGAFVLGPLPNVSLRAMTLPSGAGLTSKEVEAHAGDEGVTLVVYRGGGLSLLTKSAATGENIVCTLSAWRTNGAGNVLEQNVYRTHDVEIEWDGLTPGTWHVLANGPTPLVAFYGMLTVKAGEITGPVLMVLEPAGTLLLSRPETAPTDKLRIVIRIGGVPIQEHRLAPGATVETLLPPGQVEVVEYDPQGQAKPGRFINVLSATKVELTVTE